MLALPLPSGGDLVSCDDYSRSECNNHLLPCQLMAAKKKMVWDTKNPKKKSSKLTPAQKKSAMARAKKAGRPYPNLIDNMAAARKK